MAVMELWRRRDLEGTVKTEYVDGNFFTQDSVGNLVGVKVYSGGAEVALTGSVTGYCVLPSGETVSVAGTRSGNQASILVPQSALAYTGPLGIALKLIDGNTITTLMSIIVVVYRSKTDNVITPSSQIITDWANQISAALQEVEDASAAQDAKIADLESAFNQNYTKVDAVGNGDDFNDYRTAGNYAVTSGVVAATVLNIPEAIVGMLSVIQHNAYVVGQTYITYTGNIYRRYYASSAWGEWEKLAGASDVQTLGENLEALFDGKGIINGQIFNGKAISSSGVTQASTNVQSTIFQVENGKTYIATISGGNVRRIGFLNAEYSDGLTVEHFSGACTDTPALHNYNNYKYIMITYTGNRNTYPGSAKLYEVKNEYITSEWFEKHSEHNEEEYSVVKTALSGGYYFMGTPHFKNDDPSRVYQICDLNHGSVVYFDDSIYKMTYSIVDSSTYANLFNNTGWYESGKMIINTHGVNSYRVIIVARTKDESAVNPVNVNESVAILNRKMVYDLIMFMGQSNMAGRGETNTTWPDAAPTLTLCAGLEFRAISDPTRLYPIYEPFGYYEDKEGAIDDDRHKTGSMVVAFVNKYYQLTGVPVLGISASEGGTGIDSWQSGSAKLTDAINRLTSCVAYCNSNGITLRHKFMAWCQGESDTRLGITPEQHKTYFDGIMTAMKNAGIEKCFLCRIGEYNGQNYDYTPIINAQTEMAQDRADTVMVTTTQASFKARGLMKDTYHYYQAGYNEMGEYAGINAAEYVKTLKEPQMYDPKSATLYFSHKN